MPAIGQPLPPRKPATPGWTLRELTPADIPRVCELEFVLFPDEAWDEAMVFEEVTHPSRRYVAAANDAGELVGYAGIMLAGDAADLHTIGTVDEGCGVGTAMLRWCEREAVKGGAERLLLEVRDDNSRARKFYSRHGFHELGVRRGYYRTPNGRVDAVIMEKALA